MVTFDHEGETMEEVLYDTAAGVGRITINRPEQSNALNPAAIAALRKRLRQAEQEPAVRVVTITGAGDRSFCAGIDLKASLAGGRQPRTGSPLRS